MCMYNSNIVWLILILKNLLVYMKFKFNWELLYFYLANLEKSGVGNPWHIWKDPWSRLLSAGL